MKVWEEVLQVWKSMMSHTYTTAALNSICFMYRTVAKQWCVGEYRFYVLHQWHTEWGFRGFNPPPPLKFRRPSTIVPNSTWLWKLLKIAELRTPTPQDIQQKGSKILKLPPVRNCFTLAMINKLVIIINSLKVPKIKKILLYEMKFLVPNYSCLQNPWTRGYCPQIPFLSVLNWICWPPLPLEQNSWVRHCATQTAYCQWANRMKVQK